MTRLQNIKNDTEKFFVGHDWHLEKWPALFPTYLASLPNQFHEFERYFRRLDNAVLNGVEQLTTTPEALSSHIILGPLFLQLFSENNRVSESEDTCFVCERRTKELNILKHFQQSDDTGARFAAAVGRVSIHDRCPEHWNDLHDQKSIIEEIQELTELSNSVHNKIITALTFLNGELLYGMPLIVRNHTSFLPDEITENSVGMFPLDKVLDCLGRTWLHKYLDISNSPWNDDALDGLLPCSMNNPDVLDILGRTALHIACQKDCPRVVEKLLLSGANAGRKSVSDSLAIHYAAASGSISICRQLISAQCFDINDYDEMGHTALYYAVRHGHAALVELLLIPNHKVDPDKHGNENTRPPLIEAVQRRHTNILVMLLSAGADPGVEYQNRPAMFYAETEIDSSVLSSYIKSRSKAKSPLRKPNTPPAGASTDNLDLLFLPY
jgi:hypothetical protein